MADPSSNDFQKFSKIANELKINPAQVRAVALLLKEGASVPFIARYRKEATGSLDEVQLASIRDRSEELDALENRRKSILSSLEDQKVLTDALKKLVLAADSLTRLEDIYAPYKPKRRTRATAAKERGLQPFADWLMEHIHTSGSDAMSEATQYVNTDHEEEDLRVKDDRAALQGARDILAEGFAENADAKQSLRELIEDDAVLTSRVLKTKAEDPEAQKYKDYFEWSEPLHSVPSHRMLAMRRGEKEGFLYVKIAIEEEEALDLLRGYCLPDGGVGSAYQEVEKALQESYRRMISMSLETEFRMKSKKQADVGAIQVFADNIKELLLAAPLGQKRTLAIDPAFRTGCKTVVLSAQGDLLYDTVLHLTSDQAGKVDLAQNMLRTLVEKYDIEAVAVGNGTASREADAAVRSSGISKEIPVIQVNESGASIYSASEVAREEFPDKDLTVRGAVSIGRRLMDPLAELVKLDPKSIGVGQYQHDVDQFQLKKSLDDTVENTVNAVGVELNTASKQLLKYVSGLNETLAANIVAHREANGPFEKLSDLKKVSRLGEKTYEQCAGFLRISGAKNPLDSSGVHPERYVIVNQMAADLGMELSALIANEQAVQSINLRQYASDEVGMPTLEDIKAELQKPGRDPRQSFEVFAFSDQVHDVKDLNPGQKLPGIVTNVTNFGAFVDVGVHQDGLVHISQLSDKFVEDPNDIVKVGQKVQVTVTEVDLQRKRIALSMKNDAAATSSQDGKGKGSAKGTPKGKGRGNAGGKGRRVSHQTKNSFEGGGDNWFDMALKK